MGLTCQLTCTVKASKIPGESGWVLVTIEVDSLKKAFPVGWGKRTGDVLKNRYPRGLRWK